MITVSHLSKTYHNPDGSHLTVLKDINCEINAGEVISLIGPSGTGKSTFLRALNLLDPPTGGSIMVDGENILKKGYPVHKLRQKMGMVFQNFNLFEHMTVLENVMYAPCKIKKESVEQAREEGLSLLRKVGLAEKADVYPSRRAHIGPGPHHGGRGAKRYPPAGVRGHDHAHRNPRDEVCPGREHPYFLHVRGIYPRRRNAPANL